MQSCVNLDAAAFSKASDTGGDDHAVGVIKHFLQLDLHLLPRVTPSVSDAHGAIDTVRGSVVVLERMPLDVGMKSAPEDVGVAIEGPQPPLRELYVLLSHGRPG